MSTHLTVFEIEDDKAHRDIECCTRRFIREGSGLVRSGLELFCKAVDSLYDEATLLTGSIKPWHVAVSVIAPRVYDQTESSLVLLEKGYPAGAASCLRSALEAAQLLVLVILDEQAAIDYRKMHKRFRRGARAYKELQEKRLNCRVGDKHASEWYEELSSIAHPSPDSVPTVQRFSKESSEHVIMGSTYHPMEIGRIISRMLDILVGAITSDLCFHRPPEAPEVPPELLQEGELLFKRCHTYIRDLRQRWFSEVEKDVTLQCMIDNFSQELEKLRAQDSSSTLGM